MSEPTPVDHPVEPSELRLTEWTACGGCAAKWGGAPLSGLVRDLAGPSDPALLVGLAPFDDAAVYRVSDDVAIVSHDRLLPAARRRPGRLRRHRRRQRVQRRVRHGRAGRCMALNIAAFPEQLPARRRSRPIFERPRRRSWPRPAARSPAATRSATRSRSSASPCRAWCTRTASSARAARVAGDVLVLSKPLGTGIVAGRRCGGRQGGGDRRHAPAEPGGVRGAAGAGRRRCTRSPTSPGSASPATRGRWPSARAPARCSRPTACRSTPARWPRPSGACAPAATSATASTSHGHVLSEAPDAPRRPRASTPRPPAVCSPRSTRSASVGGGGRLHGGRPGRGRRARRAPGDRLSGCCADALAIAHAVAAAGRPAVPIRLTQEAAADPLGRAGAVGRRPRRRRRHRRGGAGRVGRPADGRCGGAARATAGSTGCADSKMLTEPEREELFDRVAGWCVGVGGRRGHPGGVRRAGHGAGAEAGRAAGHRRARRDARRRRGRRASGTSSARACAHVDRRVKADACVPVGRRGLDPGQGDPRPLHAPAGRALPALVVRHEQGLPVPGPQGGAAGLRARRRSTAAPGCSWTTTCPGPACGCSAPSSLRCSDRPPGRAAWTAPVAPDQDLARRSLIFATIAHQIRYSSDQLHRLRSGRGPARGRRRGRRPTPGRPTGAPATSGTSSGEPATEAWVMRPGCSISDSTAPSDSASVNSSVCRDDLQRGRLAARAA